MNEEHLRKLWGVLALAALVCIAGGVMVMQGGADILGAKLPVDAQKDGKPAVAYFVTILGGVLLGLALTVGTLHARRHGTAWHDRMPVIWLEGLDTRTAEGRTFQALAIIILVLAPTYGLVRSMQVANKGWLCEQADQVAQPVWHRGGEWRLVFLPRHKNQLRLMGEDAQAECRGRGVEVGWWTPVLFAGAPAFAFFAAVILTFALFRPRRKRDQDG